MRYGVRGWRISAAAVLAAAGSAMAGPDWLEVGDAGDRLANAQAPVGTFNGLISIQGTLNGSDFGSDFTDCYLIRIETPTIFTATVVSSEFNAQLYLFNISLPGGAYGLLANDDQSGASTLPKLTHLSNDGTNVIVALPGDYMLGISGSSFHAIAPSGPGGQTGRIFDYANLTEISGPDGPGGFNQHTGWSGTGVSGDYLINLTGVDFPDTPAPGSLGLLAMAGVVGLRRKR